MSYWPTLADDRLDHSWAVGASVAFHAVLLLSLFPSSLSSSHGEQGHVGNNVSTSARFIESAEFRQPIVVASPSNQSDESPALSSVKSASDQRADMPTPTLSAAVQHASPSEVASDVGSQRAAASARQPSPQANEIAGSEASSVALGTSDGNSDEDKRAAYLAALKAAIRSKWTRNNISHGTCAIKVIQTIGGNVMSVKAEDCDLNDDDRMALEAAALMAQPLPYAGFESAFTEQVVLKLSD